MFLRLFWDPNSSILREADSYVRNWDAASYSVQDTIRSLGDVLQRHWENPDKILKHGLEVPIECIENTLARMQEIQDHANEIIDKYHSNTIGRLSVKAVQACTCSVIEGLTAVMGVSSQLVANIKEEFSPDRVTSTTLRWVAFGSFLSGIILSRFKERFLILRRENEERIGKLRALTSQKDMIPSTQSTCNILKIFDRVLRPGENIQEYEWVNILRQIKQIPGPFRGSLHPHMMQSACLRTPNFQETERKLNAEGIMLPLPELDLEDVDGDQTSPQESLLSQAHPHFQETERKLNAEGIMPSIPELDLEDVDDNQTFPQESLLPQAHPLARETPSAEWSPLSESPSARKASTALSPAFEPPSSRKASTALAPFFESPLSRKKSIVSSPFLNSPSARKKSVALSPLSEAPPARKASTISMITPERREFIMAVNKVKRQETKDKLLNSP